MRMSEAIVLGSTLIRQQRTKFGSEPRCVIGMALEAVGSTRTPKLGTDAWPFELQQLLVQHWPWAEMEANYITPCDCALQRPTFTRVVIHLFDDHVERVTFQCEPWSFEELVAYVVRMEEELAAAHERTVA